tara:strand:- start:621 stop:1550 length:930 start_codon:yes stop_codon:yes gene_type:complete
MEFFNKKEEVLDVELTEYGKYLLAIGQLNPTYYAFFDDDIQYDVSGSGYSENQNDIASRIQYDTPKLKILANRTGVETRVNQFIDAVSASINLSINSDPADYISVFRAQQPFAQTGKLAANPLGNSSLDKEYNASWQLQVLSKPVIASASRLFQIEPSGSYEYIPQIDITIDYETYFHQGDLIQESISGIFPGSDNISLALKDNYLMIELIENNTEFEKENFEIEVYHSASDTNGVGLLTPRAYTAESDIEFIQPSPNNVEYYMNIMVDNEIPDGVINELGISRRALVSNADRLRLNRDIYTTENEEPC